MTRIFAILALIFAFALPVQAVDLGDDGLHKPTWLRDTFKDLREDLAEANAEGKRLMVIFEQRGCIYCSKMHEEIFVIPEIDEMIREGFFVVQINLFGDVEVTDFDGEVMPEKKLGQRWGVVFTPTMMFFPEEVAEGQTGQQAALFTMPGAFERGTTAGLFSWIRNKEYMSGEHFQKYITRRSAEKY